MTSEELKNKIQIIKRGHLGKPDLLILEHKGRVYRAEEPTQQLSLKKLESDLRKSAGLV